MKALITGSAGLIGSACVGALTSRGWEVIGIDNDMRRRFFGPPLDRGASGQPGGPAKNKVPQLVTVLHRQRTPRTAEDTEPVGATA